MNAYPNTHIKIAIALAIVLSIVILTLPEDQQASLPTTQVSLTVSTEDIKPEPRIEQPPIVPETSKWVHVKVKSGDNLARIFQRINLPAKDLQNIIDIGRDVQSLVKILPGQRLSFQTDADDQLSIIKYRQDAFQTLIVERQVSGFTAYWETAASETIIAFETTRITRDNPSLYHAGKDAGLSDNIIMKLSYIFQWDISFALDLREGDSFSLMYEEIYVEGEKVKEGDIIAASFTNMGKEHNAVRYVDTRGQADYYTPAGRSMHKVFLRDPVHFSHVSSSFNLRRLHPIHKKVMPHRGIDYAARKGTPVVAAGDGKVSVRQQNGASGKYIVIQHGEQYTTKYLHLSAFSRGVRPGKTVQQGQTIGYVGATGWATASHLHYEFLVGGVHRNPKTVKLPQASPIPSDELRRFQTAVNPIIAQLEAITGSKSLAVSAQADSNSGG